MVSPVDKKITKAIVAQFQWKICIQDVPAEESARWVEEKYFIDHHDAKNFQIAARQAARESRNLKYGELLAGTRAKSACYFGESEDLAA